MKQQGIYRILNVSNGHLYIGSSNNVRKRLRGHKAQLRSGEHRNKHLQWAWNKYGEDKFVFEKIEDVNRKQDLLGREQWFLDNVIKWEVDYNVAVDSRGTNNLTFSVATRKKISKINSGKGNPMYGKNHTAEAKKKMSMAKIGSTWTDERKERQSKRFIEDGHPNTRLTEGDVIKIREMYALGNYTQGYIGRLFGVSRTTVGAIVRKETWRHI